MRLYTAVCCFVLSFAALGIATLARADGTFSTDRVTTWTPCRFPSPAVAFVPQREFSLNNALIMLLAARNTQRESHFPMLQWTFWGFEDAVVLTDSRRTSEVQVASHPDFNVVAFRGTTTRADYVGNALFGLWSAAPEFQGGVHSGFWWSYQSLKTQVDAALTRFGRDKPVFFVGHSRGAALTTLHAAHWAMSGGRVEAIYAFAQPRLGNATFNQWLEGLLGDRYYRFDHANDVTPHVPPLAAAAPGLRNSRVIGGALSRLLQSMAYAPAAGQGLTINAAGQIQTISDPLSHELDYWQALHGRLTASSPIVSLPGIIRSFPEYHDMNAHICALSRHLDP